MGRCLSCRQDWPSDRVTCPTDGSVLVATGQIELATTLQHTSGEMALAAEALVREGPNALRPGTVLADYRIEKKLGEGGSGCVYAATHTVIGKKAAIKVLSSEASPGPESVDRLLGEARVVNQIGHPNIVEVFAFGTLSDNRPYIVMDWLRGENLSAALKRGPLTIHQVADIVDQVCRALEAAHAKGVVHRDLKPDNVYLVGDERPLVKLLDFGIAKFLDVNRTMTSQRQTRTGTIVGTPLYISPEQARGKSVDARSDIYSLGVVIFELVLARPPFLGESPMDTIAMHLNVEPPPPSSLWPGIPPVLHELLLGMLAKKPEARPSLVEVRTCMAELLHMEDDGLAVGAGEADVRLGGRSGKITARGATGRVRAPKPSTEKGRAPRTNVLLGILVILAMGVGIGRLLQTEQRPAPRPSAVGERRLPRPEVPTPRTPTPPTLGTLVVRASASNAEIVIDGRVVTASGREARTQTEGGAWHDVRVSAPGRHSVQTRVLVMAGDSVVVPVELVEARPITVRAGRAAPRRAATPTPIPVVGQERDPPPAFPDEEVPMDPFAPR